MQLRLCSILVGLRSFLGVSLAQSTTSVIVDDQSPLIKYVPSTSWTRVQGADWDSGSGHMATEDPDAYAEISYTCVSFHYLSAKYPYEVNIDISIDGDHYETVDLQDYDSTDDGSGSGTVPSVVVASYNGMASGSHTIRVAMGPGGKYAVVDAFIFDVESISTALSTTSASASVVSMTGTTTQSISSSSSQSPTIQQASPGSDAESASRRARNLAIALGVICPILALALLFVLRRRCIHDRRPNNNLTLIPNHYQSAPPEIPDYHGDGHDGRSPAMTEAGAYSSRVPAS